MSAMIDPNAVPDTFVYSDENELILNMAAEAQGQWGWWNREPEKYKALVEERAEKEIEVEDFVDVLSPDEAEEELAALGL